MALAQDGSGSGEVQDCYDLIAASQSLADFGLGGVFPVTVLESKDRVEFVRQAVHCLQEKSEGDEAGQLAEGERRGISGGDGVGIYSEESTGCGRRQYQPDSL